MKEYYTGQTGLDCLDFMNEFFNPAEMKGFLKGNILKYLVRMGRKLDNPEIEDCHKMCDYAERLFRIVDKESKVKENDNI